MWLALGVKDPEVELRRLVFAIVSPEVEEEFKPAIGYSTKFENPGKGASNCDLDLVVGPPL